jgi:hypothetical protein
MDLNTFGAIMTFAIQFEERIAAFYRESGDAARAADAEKRRATLERVRRENVVEIQLEPIEGLNAADYALTAADAAGIEATAVRFYTDVAPRIAAREAARALEKMGKAHKALLG